MWRRAFLGSAVVAACTAVIAGQTGAQPATPTGVRLYVSDETGSKVVVVDAATGNVLDHLSVGKRPRGIKVTPDGTQLIVALSGTAIGGPNVDASTLPPPDRSADGLGIVDIASHKVLRIVKSGADPETFDMSSDGKTAYVSNEDTGELTVLDLAAGQIRKNIKVGSEPEGVTLRPDGRVVYVTSEGDGEVTAVDTTTLAVIAHMKTDPRPRAIVFTKDGATAFVSCENSGTVMVLDARAHKTLGKIDLPKPATPGAIPPRPMGIVLSPDDRTLYVATGRAKSIAVIDVASRTFTKAIEDVGDRPWGIALSPDGAKLFSANGQSHDISIVDLASGKVEKRVNVGGGPWAIAVGTVK